MKIDIEKPDHTTNPNTQPVNDSVDWLVRPFIRWGDGYYGLCVQAGVVTESPDQDNAWKEYHLEYRGGDIWELEVCPHENTGWTVWRGKIPTREIFKVVMTHTENPPPIDWATATDDGQRRDALTILAEHESRYQTDGFRTLIASIRHDIISSQNAPVSGPCLLAGSTNTNPRSAQKN